MSESNNRDNEEEDGLTSDHLAESSEEDGSEKEDKPKKKRKGNYGQKSFNYEGPEAAFTVKKLLNDRDVDPNHFKTLVDSSDEVKSWITEEEGKPVKCKRASLLRIFKTIAARLHKFLVTGNGESPVLLSTLFLLI